MNLTISATCEKPIYQQLFEQISAQIVRGELPGGTCLPPIRTVAKELRISVITVKKAWEELERQGLIVSITGKGCFVAEIHAGELDDRVIGFVLQETLNVKCDRAAAAVGFVAAVVTAAAAAAVVHFNDDMPDLAAVESGSADQSIACHDAAADSGAHRKVDEVVTSPAGAEKPFGERCAVRVVLKTSFDLKRVFQIGLDRHIAPVDVVGRRGQNAVGNIRRTGRGDAESLDVAHLQSGVRHKFPPFFDQLRKNVLRIGVLVFDSVFAEDFPVRGGKADSELGSADIISQNDFRFRHNCFPLRTLKNYKTIKYSKAIRREKDENNGNRRQP